MLFTCIMPEMGIISDRNFILILQILTLFSLFGTCFPRKVKAIFVFGDSLVDVGNNNYISTTAKSDYIPHGIDFGKPTGRFTNNRTVIDIIGEEFGLGLTPPYLSPSTTGSAILKGVNYASGGAGILNKTGKIFGGRINFDAQIDNFANTRQEMISILGFPAVENLIKTSLFSIIIGSNDFLSNYFTPIFSEYGHKVIPRELFVDSLISRFRLQITRLYTMGVRKLLVANVGPIGCLPSQRDGNPTLGGGCVNSLNQAAPLFNAKLKSLVTELQGRLRGSTFLYADVHRITDDIIQNYKSYGFENADSSCCFLAGDHGGLIPCSPQSKVCPDRSKYVFWDTFHPSNAANRIIAKRLLDGDVEDIWPINVRKLFER